MVSAYAALDTCRHGGMSAMPIPLTAIWAWWDRKVGIPGEAAEHFESVIRAVDRIFVGRTKKGGAT